MMSARCQSWQVGGLKRSSGVASQGSWSAQTETRRRMSVCRATFRRDVGVAASARSGGDDG